MAAGLSMTEDNFDAFVERITSLANAQLSVDDLQKVVRIDTHLQPNEATAESALALQQLAPFGRGNAQPRLLVQGAKIGKSSLFGKGQRKFLSLSLRLGSDKVLDAVWWDGERFKDELPEGRVVDVVGTLAMDSYTRRQRFTVQDIAVT